MHPKISVVMPAYNAERYIAKAFESLINQTFVEWECLVVDDGSTDETLRIIENYAARESRIKYRTIPQNTGTVKVPKDTAIAMASSEWIFGLDADDWLAPNTIEKLVTRQAETQADAVLLRLVLTDESGNLRNKEIPSKNFDFSQEMTGPDAAKLTIGEWTIAANGMFRKELYDYRHLIQLRTIEYDSRQLLISAKKVVFVDAHYFYRRVASSVTQGFSVKSFEPLLTNKLLCELIEKNYPADDDAVKIIQRQRFFDILDKRRLLWKNAEKLSCEDRKKIRKLIRENYNDCYGSAFKRMLFVCKYVLHKLRRVCNAVK